jgi:alpha-glucosidase
MCLAADWTKGVTVFPDWYHENATDYWLEMFQKSFNPETGVDIDGVWWVSQA